MTNGAYQEACWLPATNMAEFKIKFPVQAWLKR
jgi:hypothetical protein